VKRNITRPRQERNTNDEVTKNPNPKTHPYDGAEELCAFNAGDNGEVINTAGSQDLAQLVWKYFENEIRETMIEVQGLSAPNKTVNRSDKLAKAKTKMKKNHESCRNLPLVSIRKAPAQKYVTDTNQDEKPQQPILSFEALRTIGCIVQGIKERIDAEDRRKLESDQSTPAGGERCSISASSAGGEGNDRKNEEKQ